MVEASNVGFVGGTLPIKGLGDSFHVFMFIVQQLCETGLKRIFENSQHVLFQNNPSCLEVAKGRPVITAQQKPLHSGARIH